MLIPYRDEVEAETAPLITIMLIGINVIVFLFSSYGNALDNVIAKFGFTATTAIRRPEVFISSIFLHANFLHLIGNMWFLWLYGDNVEDRLGRLPYLGLYIGSGIAGNLIQALFTGLGSTVPVIGASGAVAGIMGSYMICYPQAKIRTLLIVIFYPLFFRVPAIFLLGLWMIMEFTTAVFSQPGDHVAHWAHIGGFMLGIWWGWQRRHPLARPQGWWW